MLITASCLQAIVALHLASCRWTKGLRREHDAYQCPLLFSQATLFILGDFPAYCIPSVFLSFPHMLIVITIHHARPIFNVD